MKKTIFLLTIGATAFILSGCDKKPTDPLHTEWKVERCPEYVAEAEKAARENNLMRQQLVRTKLGRCEDATGKQYLAPSKAWDVTLPEKMRQERLKQEKSGAAK